MGKRHQGRECALQCLYQWDVTGAEVDSLLRGFWESRETSPEVRAFAEKLVRGTVREIARLDELIAEQAENWRLERMGRVDRNVLRLGVYELLAEPETPAAVVIDEAIELAKRFSSADAASFVNGILDGVMRRLEENADSLLGTR